jgi:hypothetical protein
MPTLRNQISTDSWVEDVQFTLTAFSRGDPPHVSERHMIDYLANRYVPRVAALEAVAVQASYNWIVNNMTELREIGLMVSTPHGNGIVNALLKALHNLVFRDPRPSWWAQVPDQDLAPVIREAQTFIDATKKVTEGDRA